MGKDVLSIVGTRASAVYAKLIEPDQTQCSRCDTLMLFIALEFHHL